MALLVATPCRARQLPPGALRVDVVEIMGINNQQAYILTSDPNFNPGLYDIDASQLRVVP